jgi:hypothetical protein
MHREIIIFGRENGEYFPVRTTAELFHHQAEIIVQNSMLTFKSALNLQDFLLGDVLFMYIDGNELIPVPRTPLFAADMFNLDSRSLIDSIIENRKVGIEEYTSLFHQMGSLGTSTQEIKTFVDKFVDITARYSSEKIQDLIPQPNINPKKEIIHVNLAHKFQVPILSDIVLISKKKQKKVVAFIDSGAAIPLIDPRLAQELHAEKTGRHQNIAGISGQVQTFETVYLDFKLRHLAGNIEVVVFPGTFERFQQHPFVIDQGIINFAKANNVYI